MDKDIIKPKIIKLGVLGDVPVGKTAICETFLNYDSNKEEHCYYKVEKIIKLKNKGDVKIIIYDNPGQERYRSTTMSTLKCVHGIILIFDITLKESFENLSIWLYEIRDHLNEPFIILFGNKIDLPQKEWQVTSEEINQFVQKYKLPYFETSAVTKKGIMEGILYMANEIYDKLENKDKNKDNIIIKENAKKQNKKSNCVKSK